MQKYNVKIKDRTLLPQSGRGKLKLAGISVDSGFGKNS